MQSFAEFKTKMQADYTAWRSGKFVPDILHPHHMDALRLATPEQLETRKRFICHMPGRAYHSETVNINRLLAAQRTAAQEVVNALRIVASIPPAAQRVEKAYRRDLARLQAVAA